MPHSASELIRSAIFAVGTVTCLIIVVVLAFVLLLLAMEAWRNICVYAYIAFADEARKQAVRERAKLDAERYS